jgi:hypothetical protein
MATFMLGAITPTINLVIIIFASRDCYGMIRLVKATDGMQ